MSTYNEIYSQVERLSAEEQLRLLEELAMLVRLRVTSEHQNNSKKLPKQQLDKWRGFLPKRVDALEFQQELRREWDE